MGRGFFGIFVGLDCLFGVFSLIVCSFVHKLFLCKFEKFQDIFAYECMMMYNVEM
jgi:hypothetical protein